MLLILTHEKADFDAIASQLGAYKLFPDGVPLLRRVLETAVVHQAPINPSEVIFTDERAPVETIIDSLVIRFLLQSGPNSLPGLGA